MKRRYTLRSKKPLKSGPIKSTKEIKKSSSRKSKKERFSLYRDLVEKARITSCCFFDDCLEDTNLDPHHPKGRLGIKLYNFFFLCREHHSLIHTNKTKYIKYFQ